MKSFLPLKCVLAIVSGFGAASCPANASIFYTDITNFVAITDTAPIAPSASTPFVQFVTGSSVDLYRDPFEASPTLAGTSPYLAIGASGNATYNVPDIYPLGAANFLSLLWGSVDNYNGITLSNPQTGHSETIFGSDVDPSTPSVGADFVTLRTDFLFTEITFFNSPAANAFEFSNMTTCLSVGNVCANFGPFSETPLPASVWLFGAGFGFFTSLGCWKKGRGAKALA